MTKVDRRRFPASSAPSTRARRLLLCAASTLVLPAAHAGDITDLSLEQLLAVKIVGPSKYEQKQADVAAAASIITRDEILAFGWRTLGQALASLPGVYTTYDRQYTYLGVRGFGLPGDLNTRVLVTIDGNRVNGATLDTAPFGRDFPLDMDLIERIEFIPGPGGAVYGQNAMLAVVNIVTRSGAGVGGAEAALGLQQPQALAEGRASWGGRLEGGIDLLLSASAMQARGQNLFFDYGSSGISGVANGLDGDRNRQFFGRASAGPWSFELIYGFEHKNDPTGSYQSDPLVPGQYQESTYALTQLQYQDRFLADTLQVSARLFTGDTPAETNLNFGLGYQYPTRSDWWGGEARLVSTALPAQTWMLGVEAQDNYHVDQGQVVLGSPAHTLYILNSSTRSGWYGQDEWRVTPVLAATIGLRLDHDTVTGTKTSPRLGLVWQASAATAAKLLYGIAHRSPNAFEDLPAYAPGPTSLGLADETIKTLEFDLDQRLGPDLSLRGSLYRWTLRDLIYENPLTFDYSNVQPVQTQGLEMSIDRTWAAGERLRGSLSYQSAEFSSGATVINSPRLLGKLDVSGRLPVNGLRLAYEFDYVGSRATLDGTALGGYSLSALNLVAEGWVDGLVASLGIADLFGKSYADPGSANNWQDAIEQDGRRVRLSLRYRF